MTDLHATPLTDLHLELEARMVPFAGYTMPVHYASGVMKEHLHCREQAGLFDVSHMGQVILQGPSHEVTARALERLIPVDILGLAEGRQRYGFFTSETGGILDDLMLANRGDHVFMVVNAACKAADLAHLRAHLPPEITVTEITDRALLALQGPQSEAVLAALAPAVRDMAFMDVATVDLLGGPVWVSRSGYTGEDGFEISVPADRAEDIARALLDHRGVIPIGLGARDSLRLEAGLCLYGHDIGPDQTPVAAGLGWAIQKVRRRQGARAGGFPGADLILAELARGPQTFRVGLRPEGRAPMRDGVVLYSGPDDTAAIGAITSGGFGPSLGGPVAMGYVTAPFSNIGTQVFGALRGKRLPLTVAALPFIPARFKR